MEKFMKAREGWVKENERKAQITEKEEGKGDKKKELIREIYGAVKC